MIDLRFTRTYQSTERQTIAKASQRSVILYRHLQGGVNYRAKVEEFIVYKKVTDNSYLFGQYSYVAIYL